MSVSPVSPSVCRSNVDLADIRIVDFEIPARRATESQLILFMSLHPHNGARSLTRDVG